MDEPDTIAPSRPPNPLHHVPVEITVAVGKARPKLSELLSMEQGAVLTLDTRVDDPVELYVGDRLIARGMLEETEGDDGALSVRLTEVADMETGL
ncbi:Yop proteins translocation protein Q [Rhodobacteraceae bacterium THAF1]|uniref:FliM/FliN family flagellar motor switch protein n=1 Tax=Palleronia sp. THAF1 TaxID=2587842 RepID=UPI000F41012C|nr:FliM/FliN family flagellar motor switch protein [Palleronia sp. THAF1]QFU10271.1 Yop proteins translocation protein Q [Palleronia sp. THAF1]VDC16824.1 Yop proteins translocation protein Q [Rhodobacteraceae bacterium THAF1]